MKIVFDNADFTESLSIGFKGQHQLPLIAVVKEYRTKDGEFIGATMPWSSSHLFYCLRPWFTTRFWKRQAARYRIWRAIGHHFLSNRRR